MLNSCCCSLQHKDTKNESKSQQRTMTNKHKVCCSLQHKDTKNESKSQQLNHPYLRLQVVLYNTKILKMKANHNRQMKYDVVKIVVLYNTKILKMKANHNIIVIEELCLCVVLYNTKILKMKANHNKQSLG